MHTVLSASELVTLNIFYTDRLHSKLEWHSSREHTSAKGPTVRSNSANPYPNKTVTIKQMPGKTDLAPD